MDSSPTAAERGSLSDRPIVYVASSVTHASDDYRTFIKSFKRELRQATDALVLEWMESDSHVVLPDFFQSDLNNVRRCDVMIAIVDEPSIGIGMEIMEALHCRKKVLCLHRGGVRVSRLLESAGNGIVIEKYGTAADAVTRAAQFIADQKTGAKRSGVR